MSSLYETDFYSWTQSQAEALTNHDLSNLDWMNLKEEIETMGRSEKRELESLLQVLLLHLLKIEYQPEAQGNSKSWEKSIFNSRTGIQRLLEDSPSLKTQIDLLIPKAYDKAIRLAEIETGLPRSFFPNVCKWEKSHILKEEQT